VSENAKHKIQELLNDVSQFNANDVLVDLDNNLVIPIELNFPTLPDARIYRMGSQAICCSVTLVFVSLSCGNFKS
jgi:hypothetical protein